MTQIHDQLVRGLATNMLDRVWGEEFINLNSEQQKAVVDDFITGSEDWSMLDDFMYVWATEYQNRIYVGNLESYARCLLV